MEMKSKAELTPAERLLNRCSLCLMPPMIIQMPCAVEHRQTDGTRLAHANSIDRIIMLHVPISPPHRYEQYAAEQGPGERCFDDLFITLGGSLVSSQQRRDVERHLCDGAERGVHHRSHCEVTLGGNAVGTKTTI